MTFLIAVMAIAVVAGLVIDVCAALLEARRLPTLVMAAGLLALWLVAGLGTARGAIVGLMGTALATYAGALLGEVLRFAGRQLPR